MTTPPLSNAPKTPLIVDTRQQNGKHRLKHTKLEAANFELITKKLDYGDYALEGSLLAIDTKRSLAELWQNLCSRDHERFRRECIRAAEKDGCLVVLVENKFGVRSRADLAKYYETPWQKKQRRGRVNISGKRMEKMCETMGFKYGVLWDFCAPQDAAAHIMRILSRESELIEKARRIRDKNDE